jgi:hypothetical protein
MKITNLSSRDSAEVRRLVRVACRELPASVRRLLYVEVRDTRGAAWNGCAGDTHRHQFTLAEWQRIPGDARYVIHCGVGPDARFPTPDGLRRNPGLRIADWREAVVFVTAHEAKHVERFSRGIYRNGREGEAAGDAHGRWVLEQWRQREVAACS